VSIALTTDRYTLEASSARNVLVNVTVVLQSYCYMQHALTLTVVSSRTQQTGPWGNSRSAILHESMSMMDVGSCRIGRRSINVPICGGGLQCCTTIATSKSCLDIVPEIPQLRREPLWYLAAAADTTQYVFREGYIPQVCKQSTEYTSARAIAVTTSQRSSRSGVIACEQILCRDPSHTE
jgi:hypothetical protein